jgi:benzoyl-CoA reductase/2-hydroxyglutaryl-CoA dehydratase subunit BcrC/BadD/HgdB
MEEGLDPKQSELLGEKILEMGRSRISIDACNRMAIMEATDFKTLPVDLIAPYLCLRCSDIAYLVEILRRHEPKIPLFLIDQPVDQLNKPWAIELLATQLHKLAIKISELSGKTISDKNTFDEIKVHNKTRRIAREITELWWDSNILPVNSNELAGITGLGFEVCGDPFATLQILEQAKEEISARIAYGYKGKGLPDKPKRIFVCGSCVNINQVLLEKVGAIVVGRDDNWSRMSVQIEEEGDPYYNAAKSILSLPYEQPTEIRANWTINVIKKCRADGVIFIYNGGCNLSNSYCQNDV